MDPYGYHQDLPDWCEIWTNNWPDTQWLLPLCAIGAAGTCFNQFSGVGLKEYRRL